jgi:hypothetical protein
MDFLRTGNPLSKQALDLLALNAAYASPQTPVFPLVLPCRIRETAYALDTYLAQMQVGEPANPRMGLYADVLLGDLDQMFVRGTYNDVKPFMVGLAAEALIHYQQVTGDPRVLPALEQTADWLWLHAWMPSGPAFYYEAPGTAGNPGPAQAAPDLNLLIAPMYAWLYRQTGLVRYRDEGDQAFAGGVTEAWLGNGKHFSQNYRWSFEYVRWRSAP